MEMFIIDLRLCTRSDKYVLNEFYNLLIFIYLCVSVANNPGEMFHVEHITEREIIDK